MLSKLQQLFSLPGRAGEGASVKATSTIQPLGISSEAIEKAFCGLVLGVQSPIDSPLNDFEKTVLRELGQLPLADNLANSGLLPRLPEALPYVMGMLNHQSPSKIDLVASLQQDAVLESKIIQLANSRYYKPSHGIANLDEAMSAFGRVGVRQLVVNVAFKPLIHLYSGHFTEIAGSLLWEQSEKAAIACDCMARQEKADRFKAYLTAIISNVGVTVALKILDRNFDGKLVPRSKTFHQRFIKQSKTLSWAIAREWGLSAVILKALESQIDGHPAEALGNMLCAGDKLAKMHTLAIRGRYQGKIDRIAEQLQDCFTDSCRVCYGNLSG